MEWLRICKELQWRSEQTKLYLLLAVYDYCGTIYFLIINYIVERRTAGGGTRETHGILERAPASGHSMDLTTLQ